MNKSNIIWNGLSFRVKIEFSVRKSWKQDVKQCKLSRAICEYSGGFNMSL